MSSQRKKASYFCEVCQVFCSSALHLSDHIVGSKHRNAVSGESPEFLANLQRLQYFLDTYLKDEPMIGLEYIVESLKYGSYSYKCLLCDTHAPRGKTILHLCGSKHRRTYLEEHHPELVIRRQSYSKRSEYTQLMKDSALEAERLHGRKRILEDQSKKVDGPTPAKMSKMPSRALKQLEEFKANNEFLDYLRSFEIKNDDDASFIQNITKNCTKALMKFREEQTKIQVSSKMASNGDPKNNKNPSDKASSSAMNSPKECSASAQIPPVFQNKCDATEVFFNSIKNMNASEVVNVLNKIASTNPAFRVHGGKVIEPLSSITCRSPFSDKHLNQMLPASAGINITSLMKYLQETGRLKDS